MHVLAFEILSESKAIGDDVHRDLAAYAEVLARETGQTLYHISGTAKMGPFTAFAPSNEAFAAIWLENPWLASGVWRHADAGYEAALDCAKKHGLRLPGILEN